MIDYHKQDVLDLAAARLLRHRHHSRPRPEHHQRHHLSRQLFRSRQAAPAAGNPYAPPAAAALSVPPPTAPAARITRARSTTCRSREQLAFFGKGSLKLSDDHLASWNTCIRKTRSVAHRAAAADRPDSADQQQILPGQFGRRAGPGRACRASRCRSTGARPKPASATSIRAARPTAWCSRSKACWPAGTTRAGWRTRSASPRKTLPAAMCRTRRSPPACSTASSIRSASRMPPARPTWTAPPCAARCRTPRSTTPASTSRPAAS